MSKQIKNLILGNVSSGKSTFINSFLKNSILPTSNLICTSQEIQVKIKNKKKFFKLSQRIEGRNRDVKLVVGADLSEILKNTSKKYLRIIGPSTEKRLENMIFFDIPGINNSIDKEHKKISMSTLKKNFFNNVFTVFNAENLCTTDDFLLLEEIKKEGYGTDKKLKIIINKIDKIYLSEDDSLEEVEKNFIKFLEINKIENYDVFFYSSIYFELSKKKKLTNKEKRQLEILKDFIGEKKLVKMRNKILRNFV
ncbi:MAG: dynamin family protein [Cetobacterium sp.]